MSWQEWENSKVFSHCLKTTSDGTDAMWRGRSFQMVAHQKPEMVSGATVLKHFTESHNHSSTLYYSQFNHTMHRKILKCKTNAHLSMSSSI